MSGTKTELRIRLVQNRNDRPQEPSGSCHPHISLSRNRHKLVRHRQRARHSHHSPQGRPRSSPRILRSRSNKSLDLLPHHLARFPNHFTPRRDAAFFATGRFFAPATTNLQIR